jgi:hypothetical protein
MARVTGSISRQRTTLSLGKLSASRTKVPALEPVCGLACRAAPPFQCMMIITSLPAGVLPVATTDPPSLVMATQCHLTRQLTTHLIIPLLSQVWPPKRHHRVTSCPGFMNSADRAAGIAAAPMTAPSLVWWMAL